MEDRFRNLYQLKQELYTEGAPLIIEKGSLLQDMQTNALVIQLKFHSISQKPFKALKIRINTYDVSHILLPDIVEYQYLDMNITAGEKFGSNKAILLKNSVVRSFEIREYSVIYSDDTIKTVQGPFEILPLSKTLKQEFANKELENQYRIETVGQAMYIPIRYDNLWKCTCGEWNKDNICSGCKAKEEIVFKRFNIELLTEHMEKRLAERKIIREREAKLAAEEKKRLEEVRKVELAKKQKQTKIGLCAAAIIAVVLIFTYKIYPNFIEPSMNYSHAKKMLSEKKYDDAVAEFEKLGSYKDAENMVLQAKYNYAKQLVSNKKYDDAISIFEELDGYKDSKDMVLEAKYKDAKNLLSNEKYEEAISIFEELENYKDSKKMITQANSKWIYKSVDEYIDKKEFDNAKKTLKRKFDICTDKNAKKKMDEINQAEYTYNQENIRKYFTNPDSEDALMVSKILACKKKNIEYFEKYTDINLTQLETYESGPDYKGKYSIKYIKNDVSLFNQKGYLDIYFKKGSSEGEYLFDEFFFSFDKQPEDRHKFCISNVKKMLGKDYDYYENSFEYGIYCEWKYEPLRVVVMDLAAKTTCIGFS